jgi:penicillin-binding protein 1C
VGTLNRLWKQLRGNRLGWLTLAVISMLAFGWTVTAPPPLLTYKQVQAKWQPSESWLYDRDGQLLDERRVEFEARRLSWVSLDTVSAPLRAAVIAQEDQRFLLHGGVDWLAAAGAIKARFLGQHRRGASTLSMQLAAFLAPSLSAPGTRTWRDKLRQVRAAWALEHGWSKEQILEGSLPG